MARLLGSIGLMFLGSRADFMPFADVEELKPMSLHPHCEQNADKDGHRWCRRSITKKLEDGGDVEMHWQMHVNPDNILSLDTEAQHGVRVTKCWPGELELEVPQSHETFVEAGKFIIGSSFVHGCHHYTDQHMYHRVKQVRSRRVPAEGPRTSTFRVVTETLPHMGHTARHISFNFSYMPPEARDVQRFPELRTDFGQHTEEGRRLFDFPNVFGAPNSGGELKSEGTSTGGIDTKNSVVNLSPKQISNFGWNWNFFMNESQTPTFIIDKPGTKGKIIVKNPYVKVHAGCFVNFSSDFAGFLKPPHVIWQAGFKGHGAIQGQLQGAINSTKSAELDPETYKVPKDVMAQLPFLRLLQKFDEPVWFSPIQNAVGNMPMKLTPGFQFQMAMYHKGPFEGWLAFGGRTHGTMEPILHFDSEKGFETTYQGELLDTDMWPPMWMVFTEAFEMGMKAEPKILMKGDFMGFQNAEAAIQFQPYMNITVQRDGSVNFSADAEKELTVYPTRIMGISSLNFATKYAVTVSCLGASATSAPTINWGEVVIKDRSSTFNLGTFTDKEMETGRIAVTVYEIDQTGANTTLGQGTFTCASFSKEGICDPSPAFVSIKNAQEDEVAVVQLAIVHMENPVRYYGSQLKGVGVSFPSIDVNMVSLHQKFPSVADSKEPITLHLVYTNRTYISAVSGNFQGATSGELKGTSFIELYPGFVENWDSCTGTGFKYCASPQVKLYSGSTLLAEGLAPPVDAKAGMPSEPSSILASAAAGLLGVQTTTTTPMTEENKTLPEISLFAPGGSTSMGTITMSARVTAPQDSSFYMKPSFATQIKLTEPVEFMWTVADASPTKSYSFTMTPLKIKETQSLAGQDVTGYRKVDDKILVPVDGAAQTVPAQCEQRALGKLKATAMPCSFVKELAFNSPTFMAGDYLIILTQWVEDGLTHIVYSPPFQLINSDGSVPEPAAPAAEPLPTPETTPAPPPAPAAADPLPAPEPPAAADPLPSPEPPAAADPLPSPEPAAGADPAPGPLPADESGYGGGNAAGDTAGTGAEASTEASSSSFSRRLEEHVEHVARLLEETETSAPYNVNQNVDDNAQGCRKKGLKFNMGSGARARAEVLSVGVPKDFPYIAQDSNDGPVYSTPWVPLGPGTQPENSLEDLLPKEMCEAGLCDSVLPGCRQASFKKLHFPKLVFNMSRPYYYSANNFTAHGQMAHMIKSAMSWAFSAMPEAIAVSLKQLEEEKKAKQAQVPNYFPNYNTGGSTANTNNANSFNFGGYTPQTSGQSATGQSSDTLHQWFSTQRRLQDEPIDSTARDQEGRAVKMPTYLQSHQVRVEFPGGLPYVVNHQLVSLMTRHGYFQDLDDGHNKQKGELKITGFYLEEGGSITIPVQGSKALRVTGATELAGNKATGAWVAAGSGLAMVSFAVVALLRRSRNGYATPEADEISCME
eukprot:TRINITY_DN6783_c0_g1_i2.p1 TRINITY_DN6783_c0_g1~~TRINITY_DN6783_c0_g1_i2.p1  ORF type:complete len:1436 (-),score=304.52 TRINITY_DN6783_c0_g1_i2:234-4541(-)